MATPYNNFYHKIEYIFFLSLLVNSQRLLDWNTINKIPFVQNVLL